MKEIKLISNFRNWNAARQECSAARNEWRKLRDEIVNFNGEESLKMCVNYKLRYVQAPLQLDNSNSSDGLGIAITRTNCEHYHGYNACTVPFCEHVENNKLAMEAKQKFLQAEEKKNIAWSVLWGRKRILGIGE
jgi:hypothetical protein